METGQTNTRETTAGLTPPTETEGQVQQTEQVAVRKLVGLVAGRIVNYVMLDGEIRPMLVVNPWDGSGHINGLLFFDGVNDAKRHVVYLGTDPSGHAPQFAKLIASVEFSEELLPGTWHWPQKQQVIASSVDPEALATQLMGLNESVLQKTAREMEIRTLDLVNEKLDANVRAVNEMLNSFKELLESLTASTAESARQAVEAIQAVEVGEDGTLNPTSAPDTTTAIRDVTGEAKGLAGAADAVGEQLANAATAAVAEGTVQAADASGGAQTTS